MADTRYTPTTPSTYFKNVIPSFKVSTTIGLPYTGYGFSALLGFRGWEDYTGGKAHEMAFLDNDRVYVRSGATSWETWRRFIVEDMYGNVGDVTSTLLELKPLNISPATGFPAGIEMSSATGYYNHQARGYIGLQKRNILGVGTNNDITDKVGIWIKGYYTEFGGSVPIYLGGDGYASGNCKMMIDADGRVTIGTWATSTGYKLFVEEGIRTRKIQVDQTAWADYVFNDDYKLIPLPDLEKFIRKNKHLPEVPSEEEVIKNGVDLGANQATLLKKIEELTLYIIEQEKRMDTQKQELSHISKMVALLNDQLVELKKGKVVN